MLLAGVAVACVRGAGMAASHSALLDVDHVQVLGATRTAQADVIRAAGLDRHRYLIELDGGKIARRVEGLPWVEDARVERRWPGTVRVTVSERTPLASVAG